MTMEVLAMSNVVSAQQQEQQQKNVLIPHDDNEEQEEEDVFERMFGWTDHACPFGASGLCDDVGTKLTKGGSGVTPTTTPVGDVLDYVCDIHIAPHIEPTLYSICCCGSVVDGMVLGNGRNINVSKIAQDALIPNEYEDGWLGHQIQNTTGWKNKHDDDSKFSHNYLLEVGGQGGSNWNFYPMTEENLKTHNNQINPSSTSSETPPSVSNLIKEKQKQEVVDEESIDKVTTKVQIDIADEKSGFCSSSSEEALLSATAMILSPQMQVQQQRQHLLLPPPPDGADTDVSFSDASSRNEMPEGCKELEDEEEVQEAIFGLGLEFEEETSVLTTTENVDDGDDGEAIESGTGTLSTVSIEGSNHSHQEVSSKIIDRKKEESTSSSSSSSSSADGEIAKDNSSSRITTDHNNEEATSLPKTAAEEVHEIISTSLTSTWNRFLGTIVQPMLWNPINVDTNDINNNDGKDDEDTNNENDDGEEEEEEEVETCNSGKNEDGKEPHEEFGRETAITTYDQISARYEEAEIAARDQISANNPEDVSAASQDTTLPTTSVLEQMDDDDKYAAYASVATSMNFMWKESHEEEKETRDQDTTVPTTFVVEQTDDDDDKHAAYASVATSMQLMWKESNEEEEEEVEEEGAIGTRDQDTTVPTTLVEQTDNDKRALYSSVATSMKLNYLSTNERCAIKPFQPNDEETTTAHISTSKQSMPSNEEVAFHYDDVDQEIYEGPEGEPISTETHVHYSDDVASIDDSWSTLSPFLEDCDNDCDSESDDSDGDSSSGVSDNVPLHVPTQVVPVDGSPAISSRSVEESSNVSLSDDDDSEKSTNADAMNDDTVPTRLPTPVVAIRETPVTVEEVAEKSCAVSLTNDDDLVSAEALNKTAVANDAGDWRTVNNTGLLLVPIQESPSVPKLATEESASAVSSSNDDVDLFGETSTNHKVMSGETPVDSTVGVETPSAFSNSNDDDSVSEKLANTRSMSDGTTLTLVNPPVPLVAASPAVSIDNDSIDNDSISEVPISCEVIDDSPLTTHSQVHPPTPIIAESLAASIDDGSISEASINRGDNGDPPFTAPSQVLAPIGALAESPALLTNGDSFCESSTSTEASLDGSIPIPVTLAPDDVEDEEPELSALSNDDAIDEPSAFPASGDDDLVAVKSIDISAKINVVATSDRPMFTPEHTLVVAISEATESTDDGTISATSSEASLGESMPVHETFVVSGTTDREPFVSPKHKMVSEVMSTPSTTMVLEESSSESENSYEDYDDYSDTETSLVAIFDSLVDYSTIPLSPTTRPLPRHYDDIIAQALMPSSTAGEESYNRKPERRNYFYDSDFLDVPEAPVYASVAVAMKIRLPSPF